MKTQEVPKNQFPPRPTSLAWTILRDAVREGDTAIDATAGNGHDSAFLAECVGATGRVLAFDIQAAAIRSARLKVEAAGFAPRVAFHQCSHARMAEHAGAGSVAAVMFNLGYLPGENHETTTVASETLAGLESAAALLKSGGVVSVVCYPGHQAGADEALEVESWFKSLSDQGWRVAKYAMLGTLKPAPFLVLGGKP